ERINPPAAMSLTLGGAVKVRLHAVDGSGKPVPGVTFVPRFIRRSTEARRLIMTSGVKDTATDESGTATFDWVPGDIDGAGFEIRSPDWFLWNGQALQEAFSGGDRELKAELVRLMDVSGRVTDPSGMPVSGMLVRASGIEEAKLGQPMQTFERSTRT